MNLCLSDTDHLNATYTNGSLSGVPTYQVVTPFSFTGQTATIMKAIPGFERGAARAFTSHDGHDILGQVEFHTFTSSILRFQGTEVETSDFFTKGGPTMMALTSRKFVGPDGRRYKWILESKPMLVLDDGARTVVAKFHRKHYGIFSTARPAFLEITPLGMHMVDLIMITFVYIEKLREIRTT